MITEFMRKFDFRKRNSGLIGVEQECFLVDSSGIVVPMAPEILKLLPDRSRFGFELSACQLESRIGPCKLGDVLGELDRNKEEMRSAEDQLGLGRIYQEIGPRDMPLDVYPDPTGRYQEIAAKVSEEVLRAACMVAAIHIHVGMPDHETALRVYNHVIKHLDRLCEMGDGSNGERLRLYKIVKPQKELRPYGNWYEFMFHAIQEDFFGNPRDCWFLIRISIHGTIEFRMFGSRKDPSVIFGFAKTCHELCMEAM
jgi:gamma-glutamyl:cysteine ligase YbdK (ATP-grasp superfamily)